MPIYERLIYAANVYTGRLDQLYISDAALVLDKGKIIWLGQACDLPKEYLNSKDVIHADKGWLTPGLIDCHTHLVYAGNRANEFKQRLEGLSYSEIARNGGGIQATVMATRDCSETQLYDLAKQRLKVWLQNGVTHIEIKSGYGLNLESELKMLRVIKKLAATHNIAISSTLLAAHSLPIEYQNNCLYRNLEDAKSAYITDICENILPVVVDEGLIDAIDAFCENIAFSTDQLEPLFTQAQELGIPIKLHAEQLSNQGGACFAASFNALSVDHLEYLDDMAVQALARSGTVAVLLPGAYYYLNETQLPPIKLLRQYKVPMAIATDHNPGSSPCNSLPLMMNMACIEFGLTPDEAMAGVTRNAAKALGISKLSGTLDVGKEANLVLWDITDVAQLAYQFGQQNIHWTLYKGQFRDPAPMAEV